MRKSVNPGNHPEQNLESCNEKSVIQSPTNIDTPPPNCPPDQFKSQKGESGTFNSLLKKIKDTGLGSSGLCDPMQTGQIVNDVPDNSNRNVLYRYPQAIRGCDEAMKDLFGNAVVIADDGQYFPVPIIWASQERAVAYIMQDNMRKDTSAVVDRIKLPLMSIYNSGMEFDQSRYVYHQAIDYGRSLRSDFAPGYTIKERYNRDTIFGAAKGLPYNIHYTLFIWTMYLEDMNQIVEQIVTKFSPIAYIRVQGINWEMGVKLDSIANNLNVEPGDKAHRVIKYEFNFTAEAYIPQPIVRKKAVLNTKVDFFNEIDEKKITSVIDRLEDAVEELNDRN